jgi:hypothetical protein
VKRKHTAVGANAPMHSFTRERPAIFRWGRGFAIFTYFYFFYKARARHCQQMNQNGQAQNQRAAAPVPIGKVYTEEDIRDLLSEGYIAVHEDLWCRICPGSHVRYVKRGDGPRAGRFKPGGFVRNITHTAEGKKMFVLENKPRGANTPGYISFPVVFESVETLWKKYEGSSFVEMHLIYNSLAQKKKQIEELTARVENLEAILRKVTTK